MAKAAKIFSRAHNSSGATYTVPPSKYVVANLTVMNGNTDNMVALIIDGVSFLTQPNFAGQLNGLSFPAGTTLQVTAGATSRGLLTGFEYDE